MDHRMVCSNASDIAGHYLGKNWPCRFKKRHPQVVTTWNLIQELRENPHFAGLFQTSGARGRQNGPAVAPDTPRPAPQIEDSTVATPTIIPPGARLVPVLSIRSQRYIIHQHHSTTLILILILILMYISQMSATMIQTTNYCRYRLSDKALKCQYQIDYLMAGRSSKIAVVTLTNM